MNENLNLMEVLKDCPEGTKLYSPLFGDVYLKYITRGTIERAICVKASKGEGRYFDIDGKYFSGYTGTECMLFPSKENRDWATFKKPIIKFSPYNLNPFDRILCRDQNTDEWHCCLFSHPIIDRGDGQVMCVDTSNGCYDMTIPFNDETAHLAGTTEDCPDYYKWWED